MGSVLKAENLVRNYKLPNEEEGTIKVLKGLNFTIEEEEFVGIMGRSGCGKTTLLKTLGFIANPTEGELYFKDKKIKSLWEDERADIRRREIGFVFQDFYLMDSLTVEENIMLPLTLNEEDIRKSRQIARTAAERFGIRKLLDKKPYELSGGEKQRTAICRAIAADPELILADEPTGNLDSNSSRTVIRSLAHINKEMKKTVLLVTHDPKVASYCKKILLLKDGQIMDVLKKDGEQKEFYQRILRNMGRI